MNLPPPPAGHVQYAAGPPARQPGKWPYALAAGIALLGVLVSVGAFLVAYATSPKLQQLDGGVQSLSLRADEPKWLYATEETQLLPPPCRLLGSGSVRIELQDQIRSIEVGGTTWYGIARLRVANDGEYRLQCAGGRDGVQLAIGDSPQQGSPAGSIVFKLIVPLFLVVAGGVLFLVTWLRRRSVSAEGPSQLPYGGPQPPWPGQQGYFDAPPPQTPPYGPPPQQQPGYYGQPSGRQEPPTQHWGQ